MRSFRFLIRIGYLTLLTGLSPAALRAQPAVFILGDMEKPTGQAAVVSSPHFLSPDGKITLHGAGNEVIAFQVLIQAARDETGLDLRVSDLASTTSTLAARGHIDLFLEYYIRAENASYDWFPPSMASVLPWQGLDWPDALVPFTDPYAKDPEPVAVPFAIHPRERRNQGVWVDVFIPKDTPPGVYRGTLDLLQDGKPLRTFPVALTVYPFNIPDECHVDAYGEIYRETGEMYDSGVKFKVAPAKDWPIYQRYLQMAHAHRFLATQRAENGPIPKTPQGGFADLTEKPWGFNWNLYEPYVSEILSGRLFTAEAGYHGPSPGTPPSFYPAPFIESFVGADTIRKNMEAHGGSIDPALLATWRENASRFWFLVERKGWTKTRFFAYMLDEVDSEQDAGAPAGTAGPDTVMIHHGIRQIQQALDEGTGGTGRIRLLWTSHADAARWVGTAADLSDVISWWAPNGHAVNVDFYKKIEAKPGQTVWFYHSGQPAVGNQTINQLGIDLRLWGLLCWRYGLNGSFWWSMMCFPASYEATSFNPYDTPQYKVDDSRWGNGVLFYPGARLTMIGARRNIAGPIPSMRMQAYRRGLQDYEYCWLARQRGRGAEADALLRALIPAAFSEAPAGAQHGRWSQDPADYYRMREQLADLISGVPVAAAR